MNTDAGQKSECSLAGLRLEELLDHPPAPGIQVLRQADRIEIKVRARISGRYLLRLVVIGLAGGIVAMVGLSLGSVSLSGSQVFSWWQLTILFAAAGFGGLVAMSCFILGFLPGSLGQNLVLDEERFDFSIEGADSGVAVPWADLVSVKRLRMKKPGRQLHAYTTWPWVKGEGDGLAIETTNGPMEVMGFWHHEVTDWLADILISRSETAGRAEISFKRSFFEKMGSRGMPTKIDRKSLVTIGVCCILIACLFVSLSWKSIAESRDAQRWVTIPAVVQKIETVERDDAKDRLRVTYRYEYEGEVYTGNRFSFSGNYSADREDRKGSLGPGDPIDVYVNPDDPQRSTVERGFAYSQAITSVLCVAVGLFGIATLIYAAKGKNSVMADRYAVELDKLSGD